MKWLRRWFFVLLPIVSVVLSLTLPRPLYLVILVVTVAAICGWIIATAMRRRRLPIRIHPEMIVGVEGPGKFVIAAAWNQRRAMYGFVGDDGQLTMLNSEEMMSLQAHPNFHAVKFVSFLAETVFGRKRLPTELEIKFAYQQSLRGEATEQTDIGLDELIENFTVVMGEMIRLDYEGMVRDRLVSFACEISSRLDERVAA